MTGARLQQGVEAAVRRFVNLSGEFRPTSMPNEPLTVREMPSGEEFMVEVRVLPMGHADG